MEAHWEEIALSTPPTWACPSCARLPTTTACIGMLRFYAGMATSIHGHTIGNSLPGDIVSYTRKEPVGVVGAIIPWNAPTAASIWKIGPALATGCTIVLKPSEEAPLTPLLIADLDAGSGRAGRASSTSSPAPVRRPARRWPPIWTSTRSSSPARTATGQASCGPRPPT